MYVYKIINEVNGKIYVGKHEFDDPDYMGSGKLLRRAFDKYGIENFRKEILYRTDNKVDLAEKERHYISELNCQDPTIGYNITAGGDGGDTLTGNPDMHEISRKISEKMKKRVMTEEHRRNLGKKSKGNTHGRANKGRTLSPEWRAKLSAANKAAWQRKKSAGLDYWNE